MSRMKETLMDALYSMQAMGMSVDEMSVITRVDPDDIRWILGIEED